MSIIRTIYHGYEPAWPATDQHPDAVRYQIGAYFVDALGGQPSQAELDAALNPNVAENARRAAIKIDPLCVNLRDSLSTATPAQISTYIDNNVTDLASARTMLKRIALLLALLYRNGNT